MRTSNIVIALLLSSVDALKLRSRLPELPPPEMVASMIASNIDMADQTVRGNKEDLAHEIDNGINAINDTLKHGLGVELPQPLPSGKDIAQDISGELGQLNEEVKGHGKDLIRDIGHAEEEVKRAANGMGLAQQGGNGAQMIENTLPPADFVVDTASQFVGNPDLGKMIQQALDGFAQELKRSGGSVNERFPTGEMIAEFLKNTLKHGGDDIKREYSGVREGLIRAAKDMNLAQISKEEGKTDEHLAKEVEEGVDAFLEEAKEEGFKIRIPKNAREAREDFKQDLEAFEKDLERGDFDDEIQELEREAKRQGHDFDPEELKHEVEKLAKEEDGEIKE